MPQVPLQARLLRGRDRRLSRSRLEQLERSEIGELGVVLAWLVSGELGIDEAELNATRRRAMFVLAAGGDPHREIDIDSIAVERLAGELDTPERRAALASELDGLARDAEGLPNVAAALRTLRGDPELAWRTLALAL